MSFREEYLKSRIGKDKERREKIEALLSETISNITKAGLTIEDTKIFLKVLESDLIEYRERMLRTVPFLVLPDNLGGLPYSDQRALLVNLISEAQLKEGLEDGK